MPIHSNTSFARAVALGAAAIVCAALAACAPTPAVPTAAPSAPTGAPIAAPNVSPLATPAGAAGATAATAGPATAVAPAASVPVAKEPAPYPTPQPQAPQALTPLPTVTTDPRQGTVKGVLTARMNGADVAIKGTPLYLAPLIKDSTGREAAAALDRFSSPRTFTDDKGNYVFRNVPPGRYSLILDLASATYMLRKPEDGSDLIVVVSSGNQSDMGRLNFAQLPLTPTP